MTSTVTAPITVRNLAIELAARHMPTWEQGSILSDGSACNVASRGVISYAKDLGITVITFGDTLPGEAADSIRASFAEYYG